MPKYGYKFVFCNASDHCLALIKLEIPDNAIVIKPMITSYLFDANNKKRRTNKCKFVDVVAYFQYSIYFPDSISKWLSFSPKLSTNSIKNETPKNKLIFASIYNPASFVYKFKCYNIENLLDLNAYEECGEGIHYFETGDEAVLWIQNEVSPEWINEHYKEFAETYKIK